MAADLKRRGLLALIGAVLISACASAPAGEVAAAAEPDYARVFLVRHAEKETGSDPALTADGAVRAKALAARLAGEGVTEIWSTRTNRTGQTAAPLAAELGLAVQTYDASTLPAFASWLQASPGVKLVVGHSNTTDALAALLGADPGPAIEEATEFDRLYVIELGASGATASRIERYGTPSLKVAE
jgi:broad specificity phosphatase PhoE